MKVSSETSVAMPMRNLISIVVAVGLGVWAYFGLIERLNQAETSIILIKADIVDEVARIDGNMDSLVEGDIVSVASGAVAGPHPADFEACQDENYDIDIFYIGSSSGPTVGDVFYTGKNQGVLINPLANGYYRFDNPDGNWFRIQDGAGTVSLVGTCS